MKLSAFICALAATLCGAQAKTCVWTGAKGGDYLYTSAAENWQDGQVPTEGDTVVISTTSAATIIYTFKFPLENLYFTNTLGGTISADASCQVRVTGTDSEIVTAQPTPLYLYTPIEVAEGGRLAFRLQTSDVSFDGNNGNDKLRGSGVLRVTGAKTLNLREHPNFHGTWNIESDVYVLPTAGGVTQLPFGADDCTVNVHGTGSDEAAQKGRLRFGGAAEVAGEVNLFNSTDISTTYAAAGEDGIVTFRGNVSYTAESEGCRTMGLSCSIAGADNRSGYVFLKDFVCTSGNKSCLNIYTYSPAGTFYLEARGAFCPTTADNSPFGVALLPPSESKASADVRLSGPLTSGHVWKLVPRSRQQFHLAAANILPKGLIHVGWGGDGKTTDAFLDLHGHDQVISAITYDSLPQDFVITSSGRPATLKVGNNESVTHVMPHLSGMISVYGYDIGYGSNSSLTFSNEDDLTGWIGTEKNTMIFAAEAKYPNLGGIECTGAGSVVVRAGATLNPDMTLDVHDVTGNGVRLATGVNLTVKHAFVEGADLPAGTYCRTGAGVEGATEVDWLKKAGTDTDDDMTGTVTVAEHDPVWIWTGKGSSSFADPANWGANAAPDLADANLTLNFKNAAGQADAVISLDGVIAPAGAFNCGEYSKGAVTFGGTGTLVLGGADNNLKMVFAESASLTWNGSGTLHLTGKSTSTGTLAVNSGTVVLDAAGWTGSVVVADGAELVVNASCGSEVFGAADAEANTCSIALAGKLTLGDGIAASVKALTVNGQPVRYGKTYGSSDSAAVRKDDAHFGGAGTIVSRTHGGILLIVR